MASRRRSRPQSSSEQPGAESRLDQVRRLRRRGEERRALLVLREVCFKASGDARLWTLYAAQCWRIGRRDDAKQAFRQALWLRQRAHDEPRARVLRALLKSAEQGHTLKAA